ncbi:MAG: hypothetical protein ACOCUT_01480 [bacterium]
MEQYINSITILGEVTKTPFEATINGKEKVFMYVTTVVPAPTKDGYMIMRDTFRVALAAKYMLEKCKGLKVGEWIYIVGRMSCLMKRIWYNKNGESKQANFTDTTIYPNYMEIRNFDVSGTPEYKDYRQRLKVTGEKKKDVKFKIPKKDE